ncbi:putative disease resistance protein RGA4 [Oryza brachyantha]|uniref:putative disease resistance protein RGA4 n=1 Tax=Oryza brachyantha TaxID=4533 RepID=UPI001ADB506A|nr:putative disease resistance protein RGA4 [Oryza brachyantha]
MSGGGGMLDSVVNRVAGKLWDLVVEEASLLRSFEEDVDDMMETMADLEAVLQDADDRARQGGRDGARVKWWLTKLKSVAYDVEDVLDELDAAQRIKNHQSKLKLFFSRNNQLLQKMTIAHNLKNLKEKIEKTDRKGKRLNLVRHELARGGANKETFAVIDDGVVLVGRDVEKEKVISLLLNTEAKEDISIIPIVGLGGLGKSTLAKAVYEDKRVVNFFTLNIWVQVKEFDLLTIGKDIIKGANSNIDLSNCNMRFVQDNLKKELADRRYLIVLDDLWEENGDKLESLKAMLKLGGKGSKIIATTRSERVVQTLCTGDLANQRKIYPVAEPDRVKLNGLSPDDCWKLMKRRAFGPDDEPGALEEIGLQIAEKCGGLPLVANALGQVMSEDTSTEAWEHIRDRKIVLDSVLHQRETLETLMLSYYYMKLEFKKCFTYLAAFPKGFVIDSDHLIQQWSALGYIQERNDGQSCIKYLLDMSFLEISKSSLIGLPESIDNLRCLQQLDMSGCCAFQKLPDKFGSLSKLSFINLSCCSKLRKLPDCLNLESLEHLNLSNCHELENLPEDIGNLYKLEVLDMSDCYKIQVLPETFCQLKHLKDLNLSDCHGLKELPEYFGHLSEIRSLNLTSCSKLRKLPQSLCKLHKLKHLDLSYCIRLEDLPSTFGNLQLQVLDLTGCFGLQDLPDSISNMTSLNVFNVGTGSTYVFHKAQSISECLNLLAIEHDVHKMENVGFSSIVELERLRCHKLIVRHLENVESLEDASRAKLCDMLELLELQLYWGLGGTRNVDKDKSVLENLVPPRALQIFILDGYMPKDFPNWVSGISSYLPCLMHLRLRNLATCNYLPAFGQLPNLRHFTMNNIPNIRKIGKEFYGEEGNCKKLRVIWLERMDNLEEWWTTRSGEEDEEFLIPNLHYLHVVDCPKLSFLPHPPRSINWTLDGSDHVLPERGFGNLVSSTLPFSVTINNCNFSTDNWGRLQHLATLENFYVKGCSGLRTLPDIIKCFLNLRVLDLRSQEDLELLPEWLGQLASLDNIIIFDCPKLTSLPKSIQNLTALKELWLQGCKGLEILPEGLGLLISLKKLGIIHCPNLSLLPKSMKNLTTLIELRLVGCEGLEILPELFGHLTSLKRICVLGCPSLTDLPKSMMNLTGLEEIWLGGFNSLPEWIGQLSCLKEINIFDSPNMMHLPKSMQNLDALKQLYIWNCPRLIERCRQEDANKISHIPRVILDDKIFILGQAIEGPERESE